MTSKVKDVFVTAAVCIEGHVGNLKSSIREISSNLASNYAHHEILVVSDSRLPKEDEDELNALLKEVYFVRSLKVFGQKSKDTLEAIAFENAIGDIVVAGSIEEISDSAIANKFVMTCCDGNDVVMSNSTTSQRSEFRHILHKCFRFFSSLVDDYDLIPSNFTGMCCASRRAINAASKLPRFEMFPFLRFATSMQHVKVLDVGFMQYRRSLIESAQYALDLFSYNTIAHISLICVSTVLTVLIGHFFTSSRELMTFVSANTFVVFFFIANSLRRLINNKTDIEQYSVEYDKHSSVMLDLTELNIRSDSTSDMVNKVQTGRDR